MLFRWRQRSTDGHWQKRQRWNTRSPKKDLGKIRWSPGHGIKVTSTDHQSGKFWCWMSKALYLRDPRSSTMSSSCGASSAYANEVHRLPRRINWEGPKQLILLACTLLILLLVSCIVLANCKCNIINIRILYVLRHQFWPNRFNSKTTTPHTSAEFVSIRNVHSRILHGSRTF